MELARFSAAAGSTDAYRSILYLEQVKERGVSHTKSWSGPAAIEEYLAAETKGQADSIAQVFPHQPQFEEHRGIRPAHDFGRVDCAHPARSAR